MGQDRKSGTRRRLCTTLVLGAALLMTACSSGAPEPVPLGSQYEESLRPLQQAMLSDPGVTWSQAGAESFLEEDGVCRWSPGDSVAPVGIPEDDPSWSERAEAVDEVLAPHGFDAVGDAGRRSGAPAYGFDTTRPDGARLQLYSVPGQTVIRLSGVPVDPSACDG